MAGGTALEGGAFSRGASLLLTGGVRDEVARWLARLEKGYPDSDAQITVDEPADDAPLLTGLSGGCLVLHAR